MWPFWQPLQVNYRHPKAFEYGSLVTWLITGGAGYIGAHVVREFLKAAEPVVVIDDLTTGVRERVPSSVRFYEGSILDSNILDRIMTEQRVDGVVHIAGKKSVPESLENPAFYELENVQGTATLLAACMRHGIRHFVFSSSAAVYGSVETPDPIREDVAVHPVNPYGQTKLDAELLVAKATTDGAMNAVSFRYFNVAGAASPTLADRGTANLIPKVYRALEAGEPLEVYGIDHPTRDGTCVRDYIHVEDVAVAHVLAAIYLRDGEHYGHVVVNLGTGTGSTVLEVLAAVGRSVGCQVPWRAAPPRLGDPDASVCDASRAEAMFGWKARRTLDEMVRIPD